jgi:hypothetical protein
MFPSVSHILYADYINENDEVKRKKMLNINWSTKEKIKNQSKILKDEAKK